MTTVIKCTSGAALEGGKLCHIKREKREYDEGSEGEIPKVERKAKTEG
jgi:hypothetical protein